jgi:phage FluMu protein Com
MGQELPSTGSQQRSSMAIEFHCPRCDKLLKTAEDKAGLNANCPGCGAVVTVPGNSQGIEEVERKADQRAVLARGSPAPFTSQSGSNRPSGARDDSDTRNCPMCGESVAADATRCPYCGDGLSTGNSAGSRLDAHRGGLILAFGILGWVVCFPFGIAAWIMGNHDLREMEAGRMDRSGEGLTRAGKILAIVQICLTVGAIAVYGIIAIVMIVGHVRV